MTARVKIILLDDQPPHNEIKGTDETLLLTHRPFHVHRMENGKLEVWFLTDDLKRVK